VDQFNLRSPAYHFTAYSAADVFRDIIHKANFVNYQNVINSYQFIKKYVVCALILFVVDVFTGVLYLFTVLQIFKPILYYQKILVHL